LHKERQVWKELLDGHRKHDDLNILLTRDGLFRALHNKASFGRVHLGPEQVLRVERGANKEKNPPLEDWIAKEGLEVITGFFRSQKNDMNVVVFQRVVEKL